jgi:prevent-host-death family protein
MATITARKLSRETASVIDELAASGEPVLIVRNGEPAAVLSAVNPAQVEDAVVLATAPEYTQALARADEAAAVGETETFDEIFAEANPEADELVGEEIPSFEALRVPQLDSATLDRLAGAVVRLAQIRGGETTREIPPEQLERLQEVSRGLAKRMLAESIGRTAQLVGALNESLAAGGEIIVTGRSSRFDQMLEMLDEEIEVAPSGRGRVERSDAGGTRSPATWHMR